MDGEKRGEKGTQVCQCAVYCKYDFVLGLKDREPISMIRFGYLPFRLTTMICLRASVRYFSSRAHPLPPGLSRRPVPALVNAGIRNVVIAFCIHV